MTMRKISTPPGNGPGKGPVNGRRTFRIYKDILFGCRVYVGDNMIAGNASVPSWGYSPEQLADKIVSLRKRSGDGVNLEFLSRDVLADDKEPLTRSEKKRFMNCFSERKSVFIAMPLSSSHSGDRLTSPSATL